MAKLTLSQLGVTIRSQRDTATVRETADEIGIAPATLSRVERGHTPDLVTFGKLCAWLGVDASEVLGIDPASRKESKATDIAAAHLRTRREIDPELAEALAEVILATQRMLE